MSVVQLDTDSPSELVALADLEKESSLYRERPEYSVSLEPAAFNIVQQRCAAAAARCEAPRADLSDAVDALWMEHASGTHINLSENDSRFRDLISNMAPPAFRLNKYEHLPLYMRIVPLQDQNAVGDTPQCMAKRARAVSLEEHPLLLHISVYTRRGIALTRKTRGLAQNGIVINGAHDTPTTDDMDGELVLAQRLEITSHHTLDEFVQEVVCRNAEIPEEVPEEGLSADPNRTGHWTGASDAGQATVYPKYTGAMLETDLCLLVEGQLYGKHDPQAETSYIRALLETPGSGLPESTSVGGTLLTRFADLPAVAFRQPYWMLHTGDCEHIWTLDWARPLAASEQNAEFPRTTYLQRWMQASLARQYYAPKKLVVRGEQGVPCEVCGGMRDASVAVLGGDAVQIQEGSEMRLNGMAQIVTYCCDACYRAALGSAKPSERAPRPWTVMPLCEAAEPLLRS